MNYDRLVQDIEEGLKNIPLLDPHSHLVGGNLGAKGLHDILLYHMGISDLYAAGCPSGDRLTQYPGWPSREEAHARLEEAIPYLVRTRNTSTAWAIRIVLSELYDWIDPVTPDNWKRLDALVRERSEDRSWHHSILDRLNIKRTCTELARREGGIDDERLQYSLEWGFFTRTQWGEFDTALYELERCWGEQPRSPSPIGAGPRPATQRRIESLEDVHEAIRYYVDTIPYDEIVSMATHVSTDIDYRVVSKEAMNDAIRRRDGSGPHERDTYASYIHEEFLSRLEVKNKEIVFQFSIGAEPLPHETASRISQTTLKQIGDMIAAHPGLQFQCFSGSVHANQTLCTLARELPNLSLAGYWWHSFFPDSIRRIAGERLDMLPANKQIGFFSDAYCVEWAYAKARIVLLQLAQVLAERVRSGQYDQETAVDTGQEILYHSPLRLSGMRPKSP